MKSRRVAILMMAIPLIVLAAEEAPPAELLENLEFFQHYDLVNDKQFMAQANRDDADEPEVEPSTVPVSNGGKNHENNL